MPISEFKKSAFVQKIIRTALFAMIVIAILGISPWIYRQVWDTYFATKAKRMTLLDVTDVKEMGLLAVQRIQLSHVAEGSWNEDGSKKENVRDNDVYVRRIIRGHATRSLDFSKVKTVVESNGLVRVTMPALNIPEPFIDEWIFYDSKETAQRKPNALTKRMDSDFKTALVNFAQEGDRPERAKKQAEDIIREMFPGYVVKFMWTDESERHTK